MTTLVMGNCGVGFAPVNRVRRRFLIGLMDGVEDIPGETLTKGSIRNGNSSPSISTRFRAMKRVLDVGTQVPHCAVRAYVMGERGAHNERPPPTISRGWRRWCATG